MFDSFMLTLFKEHICHGKMWQNIMEKCTVRSSKFITRNESHQEYAQ
jgi:hypothetical protein